MSANLLSNLTNAWNDFRSRTTAKLNSKQIDFVRGKISSRPILDSEGNIILEEGQRVDDEVIRRVIADGSLLDLSQAVAGSSIHEASESAKRAVGGRPGATGDQASDALFEEARRCIGMVTQVDVTDLVGDVILPKGKRIYIEDLVVVREAGQLDRLIEATRLPETPSSYAGEGAAPAAASEPGRRPGRTRKMLTDTSANEDEDEI